MPVRIIYLLEVIDVNHRQSDRMAVARCSCEFNFHERLKLAPVVYARKWICCCHLLQAVCEDDIPDYLAQSSSEGGQKPEVFLCEVRGIGAVYEYKTVVGVVNVEIVSHIRVRRANLR